MDLRSNSSVNSITTTYNTINNSLPYLSKFNSSNKINVKKYKLVSLSSSRGKKKLNSLFFQKTNYRNYKNEQAIKINKTLSKPEKIVIKKHINVYEETNDSQNISIYSQFFNNNIKLNNFRSTFSAKIKKPKDITPQICSVYNFPNSKNLYLFIPNSKFLEDNKEFDTIIKYPNDNENIRNSTENLIRNLSIHPIEKKYMNFSLIHNVTIPYNYKIRMLSFGNMPKCFLDTCERANIKLKKNQ